MHMHMLSDIPQPVTLMERLDDALAHLAIIPDDTTEATRQEFRALIGKSMVEISSGLKKILAGNLTELAKESTQRLLDFVYFVMTAMNTSVRI